jgi:hypothetical protein
MGFGAISVYIAGIIWDGIGPLWVFIGIMALDLIRIPLLLTMPETLKSRKAGVVSADTGVNG